MFNFFKSEKSNDGNRALVAILKNGNVIIKDPKSNSTVRNILYGSTKGKPVNCQVSPDSQLVVATTDKGLVCISEIKSGSMIKEWGNTYKFGNGAKAISATWIDNETLIVATDKSTTYKLKYKSGITTKIS